MEYFLIYLAIINIVALLFCAIDKHRAVRHKWRIPEASLMLSAALGGSIGLLLGMKLCRHKIRHAKFTIGVPLILIAQISLAIYIYKTY